LEYEMGLIPLQYKILVGVLALAIGLGGAYFAGWSSQHDVLVTYKAQVNTIAQAQIKENARLEHERKAALDDSIHNTQIATDSISSWYRAHPVRVLSPCTSGLPETSSDTQSSNDTSADRYASPYRPDDTEQVASRLDQLQKLLRRYGVTVE
jgi:hypothetical protein